MSTAYSQTKRVENLHLTRERDRRRGRELATFLLAGLPVACALLAYAALHIETVRVGYLREARQKTLGGADRGEPPAARRARPGVLARPRGRVARSEGPPPAALRARSRTSKAARWPTEGTGREVMNGVRRGRTRFFALILALWGAVVVGAARADPDRAGLALPREGPAPAGAAHRDLRPARLDPGPRGPGAGRLGRVHVDLRDPRRRRATPAAPPTRWLRLLGMPAARDLREAGGGSRLRLGPAPDRARARPSRCGRLKLAGIHLVDRAAAVLSEGAPRLGRSRLRRHRRRGPGGPRAPLRRRHPRKARRARRADRRAAQPLRRAETGAAARPQEGASLVLSLDSGVQFAAEHELAEAHEATTAPSRAASS